MNPHIGLSPSIGDELLTFSTWIDRVRARSAA
jgi:hypothetical protein